VQKSVVNPFDPPARLLRPAIQFLRRFDVPASRIAAPLGETPDNIRHIDSRSYESGTEISFPLRIGNPPSRSRFEDQGQGRRLDQNKEKLEDIEEAIKRIRQERGATDLVSGYKDLRNLLPRVSSAARPNALRVRAGLEENLAWFSTHLGFAQTAYFYAKQAMEHRRSLYGQSSLGKERLIAYAEAGLTASNSLLISYRPLESIAVLDAVYQAKHAARQPLGSEWYRQLGTALLQHGSYDHLAQRLYRKVGNEMESVGGYPNPISVQMNRERQQNLLNPKSGWERSLALVADAKTAFGAFSLEHVMAINWAAAVGFALDGRKADQQAQELLQDLTRCTLPFEHQGTVTKLLSMTPHLKLKGDILDRWVRFALYQNAAISK
jgi:hypothetical protein